MKAPLTWLGWAGLFLAGGAGIVFAAWAAVFQLPDCEVEKRASLLSPDEKNIAIVFDVDCGATTGFNTQLSVQPSHFAFDRDKYPPVLVLKDKLALGIRWIDDGSLSVSVPGGAYEYRRNAKSGGIAISYEK